MNPALPTDGPGPPIRVDEKAYDQAVQLGIARTGLTANEVQWLVQGVYATVMMAGPELMMKNMVSLNTNSGPEPAFIPTGACPWGYLSPTGQLVLCIWEQPYNDKGDTFTDFPHEDGWHQGPAGTYRFNESEPRALDVHQWQEGTTA
ncbi:hypothetical protein ACFPC0_11040 [Streptomyces andamanensis]|uniref:DUF551 domain-containing protein n=1 Tax=Streptomyces andamanensis TaxID=1565035 RepID=A0ABV8TCN3_9ACTN